MAFRTSARLALATLGVSALAGAGQLGVAYGLGIVRLTRVFDVTTRDQWTTQLAWLAWIAMTSAVVGGMFAVTARADRSARRTGTPPEIGAAPRTGAGPASAVARARTGALADRTWRRDGPRVGAGAAIPLALAAGVGAAIVVPLTAQPARGAQIAGIHPVLVVGLTAGLGALAGVFAAIAAMMHPVARWSLTTVGVIMWAVAVVSVAPSFSPSDPLPEIRLGVFDAGFLPHPAGQRIALLTMPVVALLVGLMLGAVARRQERSTLTIALAGLPGPALLTLAYLIAGPGTGTERYQVVPYWAAMTATGAGVLGSVLAVIIRRDPEEDDDRDATTDQPPLPRGAQPDGPGMARPATDDPVDQATAGPAPGAPGPAGDPPAAGGSTYGGQAPAEGYPYAAHPPDEGSMYGGHSSADGSKYAGYPPAGGSPYIGYPPADAASARSGSAPWSGYVAAATSTNLAASEYPAPSGSSRWAPFRGSKPAPDDAVTEARTGHGKEKTGFLRGLTASLRRRAADAPPAPGGPDAPGAPAAPAPAAPDAVPFAWMQRPEPVAQSNVHNPTPLTTPPVAPPPIAPPPVAPPPASPGRAEGRGTATDKRRSGKQQQDEDYVDWVSGLGG